MFTRFGGRPLYWGLGGVAALTVMTAGIWLLVMTPDSRTDLFPLPGDASPLRVHTLALGPSNAYLIEGMDGAVLVDAGLPGYAGPILAKLEELGHPDLRLIYITHAHVDHYGSAAAVQRATGAPIAVHADDAGDLATGETRLGSLRGLEWLERPILPLLERAAQVEATPADIILKDGDRLDDYGLAAEVVHTPGHTPGSTTLLLDNGVAFAGDLVSMTGSPHLQRAYATDWRQLTESWERLQELAPALIYAGHGDRPMTKDELQNLEKGDPCQPTPRLVQRAANIPGGICCWRAL